MTKLLRLLEVCTAVVVLITTAGCGGDASRALKIDAWTLVVASAAPRLVRLPTHLDVPDEPIRYELRATVPLPPELRGRDLGFVMPYFAGRAELYLGDRRLEPFDRPPAGSYRGTGAQGWHLPAELVDVDELRLVLAIDHRWTQSAWLDSVPRLTPEPDARRSFSARQFVNDAGAIAALAALLIVGFTYFVLFLFDRRRAAHGWFSLGMTTAAVYPLFNLGWTQPALGVYDVPLLGLALVMAPLSSIHFLQVEFRLGPTPRTWWLLAVAAVVTAAFAHDPYNCTRVLGTVTGGAVILAVGYQLWTLTHLVRKRPRPMNALTFLLCQVVLALAMWNDLIGWLGLGEPAGGVRVACWGLAAFTLLQSVALTQEHILAHRRAELLNVELADRIHLLEARQREIQLLNDELRRQIAERSHDLSRVAQRMAEPTPAATSLAAGQTISDRYRLVREIGSGGMGTVHEVVREIDGRRFAMKVLNGTPDRMALARFAREAEIVARIDHPNVIRIYDVGISPHDFFLVMELVDGVALSVCGHPSSLGWTLDVLRQTSEGLAAIHAHGFVHRDIKPGNLLLSGERHGDAPLVKITDFGISALVPLDEAPTLEVARSRAKNVDERDLPAPQVRLKSTETLTRTGTVLGTPPYVAPELHAGTNRATPAADIFAFGVIAYELLAGKRPFTEPAYLLAARKAFQAPTPLASAAPRLDSALAALLDRCLCEDPAQRPDATTLAAALRVVERAEASA